METNKENIIEQKTIAIIEILNGLTPNEINQIIDNIRHSQTHSPISFKYKKIEHVYDKYFESPFEFEEVK